MLQNIEGWWHGMGRRIRGWLAPRPRAVEQRKLEIEGLEDRSLPSTSKFIGSLYLNVLGRKGSASEIAGWVNSGLGDTALASIFLNSPERRSSQITAGYQAFLGRTPDTAGKSFWLSQLVGGAQTEETFLLALALSPEYAARNGSTNTGLVNGLYKALLNRTADPIGASFWIAQLNANITFDVVVNNFLGGTEYQRNFVQNDYSKFLGRKASPDELSFWLAQLSYGNRTRLDQAAADSAILGSGEYSAKNS